ncbi:MAG: PSD1 and planctomycete cytochrome C domain-containing protein [Bryobacteraceae bacterium]
MRWLLLAALPLAAQPRFEKDVLPIFTANCFACHGGRSMVGLDLRTATSALAGSSQGPVIVKGDSAKSLLFKKVSERVMPPPAFNLKLTDAQIETIKQWIDAGCPSDEAEAAARRWKEQQALFQKEALPVLKAKCFGCHASDKPMGGLDLRTLEAVLKGGANGPVVHESASDKSILIRLVSSKAMPPKGAGEPLGEVEIRALRRWVDATSFPVRESRPERTAFSKAEAPQFTAEQRGWWAFQKPVKKALPAVNAKARVRTAIDNFVISALEAKSISLSPDASTTALVRRAFFDLTGLPPSPEEIAAFQADTKPGAWERLVDRLLESPHYAERQARTWLDAAGYTDAAGFDNCFPVVEVYDGIWRYRDWVIDAFRRDKPYDRFLIEQFAGDELHDWRKAKHYTPEIKNALVATGFLRSVFDRTDPDIVNLVEERYDVLFDLIEKISTGVMGITVNCARCHTHKFDPIAQRDYYRLQSVFLPAYNPMNWKQPKNRWLADVPAAEEEQIKKYNAEIDSQVASLRKQIEKLRAPYEEKLFEAKLATLPDAIRAETKTAISVAAEERTEVQKFLAGKFEKQVKPTSEDVDKAMKEDERAFAAKLRDRIKTLEGFKRKTGRIEALWDVGPPPVARLLQRGNVESPGPRVTPGVPEVLGGDLERPAETPEGSSGLRLAFAKWLTRPDNPLTARVFVNRVWQQHFGRGIVETVDNFGKMGSKPTHPELLDWLAVDFAQNGWSVKRLHRMIMTSSVYRQASRNRADAAQVDPENKLLWRKDLMRLDAESVRDGILAASGKLDRAVGGPAVKLKVRPDGLQEMVADENNSHPAWRRSLYVMSRRNYPHQFLQVFDFPSIQVNCVRRSKSATPLQSLALMNDEFMFEQARYLADRVRAAADPVEQVYLLAFARKPDAEERSLAKQHLERQSENFRLANTATETASSKALESLCQMLLASNEFLYVD